MASDDAANPYEVNVKGPGIAADKNVDLPRALAVLQIIFGEGSPPPVSAVGVAARQTGNQATAFVAQGLQPVSIREFLADVAGKTIHAKIAAVGRYMRDHEGLSDFSRDDVKSRFRAAGELMPGNFPRDFQKAVQSGWIGEDPHNSGRFYVTRTGDETIDRKFDGAPVSVPRARRRRRRNEPENRVDDQ
jgi:hypothetical protein